MTLRDVLLTELWSKQTSRSAWKVLGISFGAMAVVVGLAAAVEFSWLTSAERSSAKLALAEIENLPKFENLSFDLYKARRNRAEAAVKATEEAASTIRDERVSQRLLLYELTVDMQVTAPIMQSKLNEFYTAHPEKRYLDTLKQQEIEKQTVRIERQMQETLAKSLHRDLN